jgi:serine-type D-Ala-D-Ala carboxypeptidase (penicillin-binding protein 5/6)
MLRVLWRILVGWLLAIAVISGGRPVSAADSLIRLPVAANDVTSVVLYDRTAGRVLFEKSAHKRLPPASLTKVMTALLAVETGRSASAVTIGPESMIHQSPRLGLEPGDRLLLGDLVSAMLMLSANDACRAVAQYVGGSENAFVALMNQKAAALGMTDSHFSNPCGFDGPDHYSTAADLAHLAEEALKYNVIAISMRTVEKEIQTVDAKRHFTLRNHTLDETPFTMAKTGFTQKAGHCLIAVATRDGRSLLLVGLDFRKRWQGAAEMLRYGFETQQADGG